MPDLTDRAFELAKRLLSENHAGRSWRRIAREDYADQVHFATLNRIANSEGEWVPRSRKTLRVLGLLDRKPEDPPWLKQRRRAIRKMVKETKKAVLVRR
jgi:hypothetical protein